MIYISYMQAPPNMTHFKASWTHIIQWLLGISFFDPLVPW